MMKKFVFLLLLVVLAGCTTSNNTTTTTTLDLKLCASLRNNTNFNELVDYAKELPKETKILTSYDTSTCIENDAGIKSISTDFGNFLNTSSVREALCIAKKHNVSYVLLT